MAFEVRPIRLEEREECIALWTTVWPGDTDAYFRKYFFGDVEWLPYYTQVGVLDGRLVSAAHVCKRTVAFADGRLTMGGVANVVTLPEYRGMGYNTRCLQRLIAVMEADAVDFTLLGTGINAYYERLAYETLPLPWISGTLLAHIAPTLDLFRVRAAEAGDVGRMREIYTAYNRHRPIAVQRSAAYWRDWIGVSETEAPDDTLVAVDTNNRLQGYVRQGVFQSAVPYSEAAVGRRVTELGIIAELNNDMDEDADTLECTRALLNAVAAGAIAGNASELRLAIPLDPAVLTVAQELLSEIHWNYDTDMMVRLLHPDNLFKSLTPAWNDRWIAAGRPPGHITFVTPYGAVTLDANRQFLRVNPADRNHESLTQAAFFGLLFGLLPPEQATTDPSRIQLLKALFPSHAAVFYGADGF